MQFKEGTTVYTSDGKTVGDIERFVLDPRAREIRGLVVRKGFLFTADKVIPVDAVAEAQEDRVSLRADSEPDSFPLFEESHYITPDKEEVDNLYEERFLEPLYYYPPSGASIAWYGTAYPAYAPRTMVTERNIPVGTIPLKEGAHVISRDGKHVGNVEEIFTESKSDKVTHFLISKGLLFKEEKLMPVHWIDKVHEGEVRLAVNAKSLESLHNFESYKVPQT